MGIPTDTASPVGGQVVGGMIAFHASELLSEMFVIRWWRTDAALVVGADGVARLWRPLPRRQRVEQPVIPNGVELGVAGLRGLKGRHGVTRLLCAHLPLPGGDRKARSINHSGFLCAQDFPTGLPGRPRKLGNEMFRAHAHAHAQRPYVSSSSRVWFWLRGLLGAAPPPTPASWFGQRARHPRPRSRCRYKVVGAASTTRNLSEKARGCSGVRLPRRVLWSVPHRLFLIG